MNNLWDNPGSRKKKRRLGRGPGSSKGQTAGRGENGQKSRSGGTIHPRFEGGQSSIVRRLPKMGFSIRNLQRPIYINMNSILYFINKGTLDPTQPITIKALHNAGAFKTAKYGIKILGRGADRLDFPLHFEVTDASESAIKAIKDNGGSVKCHYKTKLLMKEAVHPEKFPFKLRDPLPSSKQVEKLEKLRARGAEVFYKVPEWKAIELEQERKEIEQEKELIKQQGKQNEEFNIPFPRHPGVGKDKIRKRKPVIWRTINYNL